MTGSFSFSPVVNSPHFKLIKLFGEVKTSIVRRVMRTCCNWQHAGLCQSSDAGSNPVVRATALISLD